MVLVIVHDHEITAINLLQQPHGHGKVLLWAGPKTNICSDARDFLP